MKKTLMISLSLVALGLVGCSGSACDEVADYYEAGVDEACAEQTDCQFCECWEMDMVVNSTGDGCEEPPEGEDDAMCSESEEMAAQDCIDTGTCEEDSKAAAETAVMAACSF
ncbi:MAG TPA: hypothetical protein RMH99_11565 [Sandaracinaceae bacterium LLY-WYZ-13_1]|nr:hypothetical protein [Sandaracinaceae bacterium LLY-WYZ-13_1]